MTDTDKTYNGWTNYETWNVNLWLDNDRGTYKEKREIIRLSASEPHKAAQALRAWIEEMQPDLGASLWSDLLGAALSEVDWDEIVDAEMKSWMPKEFHEDDDEESA